MRIENKKYEYDLVSRMFGYVLFAHIPTIEKAVELQMEFGAKDFKIVKIEL